jgi:hypothetical protein
MAEIEQSPGELNISKIIRGDDLSFTASFDGDATADTFAARIDNGNLADVDFVVSKSYSGITLKTTLVFTLTAVQTATLEQSTLPWYCTQTTGGLTRTLLAGRIGVYLR